jgi:S1-C subfamily serine protease
MRSLTNRLLRHALVAAFSLGVALAAGPAAAQKPTGQPGAPQPGAADVATEVTIVNRSRTRIDIINISPVTDTNWGRDWLGRGTLAAGRSMRFEIQDAQSCAYDIRVIYQDRRAEELRNIDICERNQIVFTGQNARAPNEAQQQPPPPPEQQRQQRPAQRPQPQAPAGLSPPDDVAITNRSQVRVIAINFSPSSDPNWGENRLGPNTLSPRATVRYPIDPNQGCTYDFRVVFQDQQAEEQRNVDICNGNQIIFTGQNARPVQGQPQSQQPSRPPPPPPVGDEPQVDPTPGGRPQRPAQGPQQPPPQPQGDPDFILVNGSQNPIVAFNASPATDPNWGDDRLRAAPIQPGARHIVRLRSPGVCIWDVRVIYQDQRAEERRNVNLCELTELVFTGENAREARQTPQQAPPGAAPAQPGGQQRPAAPRQALRSTPSITVVNNGPAEILELYATPATANNWGPDRLGRNTLPAERRFELQLPAEQGCVWHLRVVYLGGRDEERRQQNLCAMENITFAATIPPGILLSTGTGFYVTREGHILTNRHVVQRCGTVAIARPNGQRVPLRRLGEDAVNDLALLQLDNIVSPAAVFRAPAPPVRAGDRVVVMGYPARQVLGDLNVTEGLVSALRGPRGDASLFQYTAPTQGGNSGGPILDESGLVLGVVVAGFEQLPGGRQAQNINFGIQLDVTRRFLQSLNVNVQESAPSETRRTADIAERSTPFVLPLDCLS